MNRISLSQGQSVLVDDDDYPQLSGFKWSYRAERNGSQGYAVRHWKVDGKDRLCYLHRSILTPPENHEVIFLNHDRLDCRRDNLKIVTKPEARQHHRVRSDSQSGTAGVRFNADSRTWSAHIYRNGRDYPIGTFYREEDAVAAREEALRRENPELHSAPARIERLSLPEPAPRDGADADCTPGEEEAA
jgi:hypothetical protein